MTRAIPTSCTQSSSARASPPYWTLPLNTTVRAAQWLRSAASKSNTRHEARVGTLLRGLFLSVSPDFDSVRPYRTDSPAIASIAHMAPSSSHQPRSPFQCRDDLIDLDTRYLR